MQAIKVSLLTKVTLLYDHLPLALVWFGVRFWYVGLSFEAMVIPLMRFIIGSHRNSKYLDISERLLIETANMLSYLFIYFKILFLQQSICYYAFC